MTRTRVRRGRGGAWLFLAPALLFYAAFVLYPLLDTVWYSLYQWDGVGSSTWVGFNNYVQIFTDPNQVQSLEHALGLIVFFSVIPIILGLALTAAITSNRKRSWAVARTIIFLPQVLPLVAVAVAWQLIYSQNGLVNQILGAIGLSSLETTWLGSGSLSFPAVGLVGTWVCTGLCMVLFLSGVQRIDPSLYEAVRLDGGNKFREFLSVTIPGLRNQITVVTTITVIAALASFDVIYVMTRGGPGSATIVPGVEIYSLAFQYGQVGQAAALGVVLSLLVYAFVVVINFVSRERN